MLIEEQEEIIAMLERLRAKKRYVLLYLTVPELFFFFLKKRNLIRADFVILQITVARLLGQGD